MYGAFDSENLFLSPSFAFFLLKGQIHSYRFVWSQKAFQHWRSIEYWITAGKIRYGGFDFKKKKSDLVKQF